MYETGKYLCSAIRRNAAFQHKAHFTHKTQFTQKERVERGDIRTQPRAFSALPALEELPPTAEGSAIA
jgi:hypothetical protein